MDVSAPRKPMPVTAILMIVFTALWVLAATGLGILTYFGSESSVKWRGANQVVYLNSYGGEEVMSEREHRVKSLATAAGASCCPTVPYGISMLVLGVIHFARRSR